MRATLAAGLLSLTPLIQSWGWIAEDLAAFRVLWGVAAITATLLALLTKRRVVALVCLACAAANGAGLLEPSTRETPPGGERTFRLLHHNVARANTDRDAVRANIAAQNPDVVVLVEVDAAWIEALAPALAAYEHRLALPSDDHFGIAVYSRLPAELEARTFGLESGITGTLEVGGATVSLTAFHGMPPVCRALRRRRDEAIASLSVALRERQGPRIVSGDFNAAPWAPVMRRLREETGLAPVAVGLAAPPTWPAPLPRFMRVPIDQVLTSADLELRAVAAGPSAGSDHHCLIVDVALPATTASR